MGSDNYYYIQDALGSVRQVWLEGSTRAAYQVSTYKPFGIPVSPKGSEDYTFAAERMSAESGPSGLYCIGARSMDPGIGRFISLDPQLGSLSIPQTLNRYVYCVNNPLRYVDPTGEGFWNDLTEGVSDWWDEHGDTVIQVAIVSVAVIATVATAGIASPLLAVAVGAAIGATSSFASTFAATGDPGASLKSAAIGGIAGAIGGAIGARFAQMGMAARAASKAANVGKASSGLTSADDAAGLLRTLFKHDFIINPKTGLSTGIPKGLMSEGAESSLQRTIAVGLSRQNDGLLVLKTALEYTLGGAATSIATEYVQERSISEFSP